MSPVQARPPSGAYQLRKLVRRNRALVISTAAILITLIGATVISTREAIRAVRAERSAAASLKQSQEETAKAQACQLFSSGHAAISRPPFGWQSGS